MSDHPAVPTIRALFGGFLSIGVIGFGGVLPWARRMIVAQRGWLTPAEFTDLLGQLSLISVGSVNTVLPELKRQVVERHGWVTASEFAARYVLAQAAPGPNMLVSTLIGWRVAGPLGALVTTGALVGPCAFLTWLVSGAWHRFRDRPLAPPGPGWASAGHCGDRAVGRDCRLGGPCRAHGAWYYTKRPND